MIIVATVVSAINKASKVNVRTLISILLRGSSHLDLAECKKTPGVWASLGHSGAKFT